VLREFADDLNDPIGDLVAVGLLISLRRGARTSAVLGSLADQVRFQSERRRLVEAERAPARREVSILVAIMTSLIAALLLAGRNSYLDAYDSPEGQLLLVVAIAVFAGLIRRASSLSVFPRPARFLRGAT
jgi:Flp pilus assembly protein TadB